MLADLQVTLLFYFWMIIQIVGESLPISSSGHVLLLQRYMHSMQDFWAFDYVLQGISAIIFFIYFFSTWWQLIIDKPMRISALWDYNLWVKKLVPVFLFGIIVDSITFLLWYVDIADVIRLPLFFGFMITAAALWSMQYTHEKRDVNIWSIQNGLILGFVQGCALLPGISRFGTTVATLQWLGYPRHIAFAISFLVQWPLIVAGSLVGIYSLQDSYILDLMYSASFFVTMFIAGSIAYTILYGMEKLIDKNQLWKISYYMIIPIVIALWI
ncbi:MAG: undecaprenyl-diphosphate phosphatase [Candidatus Dependentiae bacterium]|nr:undecaprenyl-diphosphate phosphatase [Candidatus Dependentiae bacterium]